MGKKVTGRKRAFALLILLLAPPATFCLVLKLRPRSNATENRTMSGHVSRAEFRLVLGGVRDRMELLRPALTELEQMGPESIPPEKLSGLSWELECGYNQLRCFSRVRAEFGSVRFADLYQDALACVGRYRSVLVLERDLCPSPSRRHAKQNLRWVATRLKLNSLAEGLSGPPPQPSPLQVETVHSRMTDAEARALVSREVGRIQAEAANHRHNFMDRLNRAIESMQ